MIKCIKKWDIFCRIVDNFGDIGVCWRLARQLHQEHNLSVRLWVDDWSVAKKLIPDLNNALNQTVLVDGVEICNWDDASPYDTVANVVVETFSCGLPSNYLALMTQQKSIWVNLEYLSAESWVDDFHGKPSPQLGTNLTRYFYFPGFTELSGGLLRETTQQQSTVINQLNIQDNAFNISLFAYPHADISALINLLIYHNKPVHCYVPESVVLPEVAKGLQLELLQVGDYLLQGQLHLHVLPFLEQDEYDALLAACDLNFVRGEDSWVRAIWAGKPFIWQPYFQEDKVHLNKLSAFLNAYFIKADEKIQNLQQAIHLAWSEGGLTQVLWQEYMLSFSSIKKITSQATLTLKKQSDLATKLVNFCHKIQQASEK